MLEYDLDYPIFQLQVLLDACTHPIDPMGIHLLHCDHDNEHIGTHDGVRNTFATIVWDVGFHVG
jgi:hypothetical protein